ncbi:MAG: hypothetical protein ABIF19_09025 [Planctomycetota bacterium]
MTVQSRQTKVLMALLVSIIFGGAILSALGHNPPSAGAFCLSRYYRLVPVEKAIESRAAHYAWRWKRIEIYYSGGGSQGQEDGSSGEGVRQLGSLGGVVGPQDINCHLIICDGYVGRDGQIQPTEKWERQSPVIRQSQDPLRAAAENENTVFICIITNDKANRPTAFQIIRTEALVQELCRRFEIGSGSILYPNNWQ